MEKSNKPGKQTVGFDLSDKVSTFVVLDSEGQIVTEGKVKTTREAIVRQFAAEACIIALEVGGHSPWVSRLLLELGHEVIVANPREVALIARNQRKTDRLDALRLAQLARVAPDLLSPVRHRSQRAQVDLELLRARDVLVAARTSLINHIRSVAKSLGVRLPVSSSSSFHLKVVEAIPEELRPVEGPLLATLAQLTEQIRDMDRQIEELIQTRYPAARALMEQINGVGPITALAYVLTIEEPGRFKKSRDVGPYLGLTRRQRDSGESMPQLHITKAGDRFLRKLLIQCGHYILGPFGRECDLRQWGLTLADKHGRKRAIVAVARKLAVLMHSLWSTGEVYEPLRRTAAATA